MLDRLLTEPDVTSGGRFYSAYEARNLPGCVQRPRIPFAVAAFGPRGLGLAARFGQAWVSTGDPTLFETGTPEDEDLVNDAAVQTILHAGKVLVVPHHKMPTGAAVAAIFRF